MKPFRIGLIYFIFVTVLVHHQSSSANSTTEAAASRTANALIQSSDLPGGICIVLGRTDAELALSISSFGRFTVQALYHDESSLNAARKDIDRQGVYGKVSADLGRYNQLPYTDNLVNIIVADNHRMLEARGLSATELYRVLTPRGVVFIGDSSIPQGQKPKWLEKVKTQMNVAGMQDIQLIKDSDIWLKATKPWPSEIDEWTHFLHGADGNPVANDSVVAPPKHYQWISKPLWLRSHESDSSIKTLVTARGRLFYIADEAPISLLGNHSLPDKWFLTARDAFNGVLLWKVPIEDWGWRVWKSSWFTPRPGDIPLNIQKRLVAVKDKLYVTLGYHAPVSELDAKTGKVLKIYEGTAQTAEILYHDGTLILTILQGDSSKVMSVDAKNGKQLWTSKNEYSGTTIDYYRFKAMHGSVTPAKVDPTLNIATDGRVVSLLDGQDVVCLDFDTGRQKWRTSFPLVKADYKAGNINAQQTVWTGTLIVRDNVVVHASPNQLAAFSTQSGEILWTQAKKYLQHLWYEWKDVFIIDGLVWTWSAELEREKLEGSNQRSTWPVSVNGYDLHTGQLSKKVPLGNIFKTHHHHRCYRNKATSRYILASRRGTEFVDLEQGKHSLHNWVRGTCHLGMMPANGLQYAPPHPCVCYIEEKLNGFTALAPAKLSENPQPTKRKSGLLDRGTAYGKMSDKTAGAKDWPAFLHDSMRSGATKTKIPKKLELRWNIKLSQKISPPIIVGQRIFLALKDEHQIAALNSNDGQTLWKFFAAARIDSPPTYYKGTVLFGSADGFVYCLDASNGKLKWRFSAAPEDRHIGAFGQLESVWPVNGSVLVVNGTAYFAAGRTSQLDGGIYLYGLDAITGRPRCQTTLEGPHYNVDNISQNYQLPMGTLPDIMQSDGSSIYMRDVVFNTNLENNNIPKPKKTLLIRAKGGLLDDSYFKRAPWLLDSQTATNTPASGYGRLIVHDKQTVFFVRMFDTLRGLDPKVFFTPAQKGYLLFAMDKQSGKQTWAQRIPVRVRTMVSTEKFLLTAGPPDIVDSRDPLGAFEGRKGGLLDIFDKLSGNRLAKYKLDSPPVFNGAAVANGKLYISMEDGTLASYGGKMQSSYGSN
ncbi:MAG: PQQ-binding-like beta-propeller repeat protein [Planctomycetes bacterium]|nr:PQQ-binding-like beta-propeller repeat protein [Planctomycetota bacterium]